MRQINILFASIAAALCLAACTDNTETPVISGSTIFLPNVSDTTLTVRMPFEDEWKVSKNTSTWFAITPLSGAAGTNELSFTILDINSDLQERVGSINIEEAGVTTQYFVVQDPTPGFSIASQSVSISGDATDFSISLQSNVGFDVTTEAEWLTVNSCAATDSTLLSDNTTYSQLKTYTISLSAEANIEDENNSGEVRETVLTLNGKDGMTTATITVSQMGDLKADFSRTFLRRSLAIRFTATGCPNCPSMNESLMGAIEDYPNHLVPVNMHISYQGGSELEWDGSNQYYRYLNYGYIPVGLVNSYARVENSSGSIVRRLFADLAKEAVEELPANTAIGGIVNLNGDNIEISLGIGAKESGNYRISVLVLEDSIVAYQSNGGSRYIHDNVVRAEVTEMWGDPIQLTGGEINNVELTCPVPQDVENPENLHIVAIVNYEDTYKGSVDYVIYGFQTGTGYVTDNVVDIKINNFAIFEYED